MIADALKEAEGIEIDRRRIDLKNPIKTAGDHEVVVSIYRDIKSNLSIVVGNEETFAAAEGAEVAPEAAEAAPEEEAAPAEADAQ
jgi:large subunit ribosomal protein L9